MHLKNHSGRICFICALRRFKFPSPLHQISHHVHLQCIFLYPLMEKYIFLRIIGASNTWVESTLEEFWHTYTIIKLGEEVWIITCWPEDEMLKSYLNYRVHLTIVILGRICFLKILFSSLELFLFNKFHRWYKKRPSSFPTSHPH